MNPGKAPLGVYIHVPFCVSKCPYCDFYSLPLGREPDSGLLDRYTTALERELRLWGKQLDRTADTLYFGGGTPSLLGPRRLTRLLDAAAAAFSLTSGAEITLEANPGDGAGGNLLRLCRFRREPGVRRHAVRPG